MIIRRLSPFSKKWHERDLDVTEEQLLRYYGTRALIQDVFPHLSADDREFIKTGITSEEWDAAFGKEEE